MVAAECALFVWLIGRTAASRTGLRRWMLWFFGATAVAAVAGGTMHGFFNASGDMTGLILWRLSLLSIGVVGYSEWLIGADLVLDARSAQRVHVAAGVLLVAYTLVVLFVHDAFWVAIIAYLPAALFLLVAVAIAATRFQRAAARLSVWGLALSFVAAGVQQLQIGLRPRYFNHNALYHLIQAVALALIFLGFRAFLQEDPPAADRTV